LLIFLSFNLSIQIQQLVSPTSKVVVPVGKNLEPAYSDTYTHEWLVVYKGYLATLSATAASAACEASKRAVREWKRAVKRRKNEAGGRHRRCKDSSSPLRGLGIGVAVSGHLLQRVQTKEKFVGRKLGVRRSEAIGKQSKYKWLRQHEHNATVIQQQEEIQQQQQHRVKKIPNLKATSCDTTDPNCAGSSTCIELSTIHADNGNGLEEHNWECRIRSDSNGFTSFSPETILNQYDHNGETQVTAISPSSQSSRKVVASSTSLAQASFLPQIYSKIGSGGSSSIARQLQDSSSQILHIKSRQIHQAQSLPQLRHNSKRSSKFVRQSAN
jgi:hypothetical protein